MIEISFVHLLCSHISIGGTVCEWHYVYIYMALYICLTSCLRTPLSNYSIMFKFCALWVYFYWPLYSLLSDKNVIFVIRILINIVILICDNICDNIM